MTQPLNICFLKRFFKAKGGLEKQANLIISHFQSLGHEITIACESAEENCAFNKVMLKTKGPKFYQTKSFSDEANKFIASRAFDFVFSFDRTINQTAMRLGNGIHRAYLEEKKKHTPWPLNQFLKPIDYVILNTEKKGFESPYLQKIITNSWMVKDELLRYYSVDPNKIHVLHNGVEWRLSQKDFDASFSLPYQKMMPLIDCNKVQILFVGHGFKRKGLHYLIKALQHVNKEDFQLHVVGVDKNPFFFESLSKSLGLEKQIFFHGKVSPTTFFYQLADLTIIPSIYDPFANVTVEALSFGSLVLSSEKNGGSEVIAPFMGEVIKDLADDLSFAKAIKRNLRKKNLPLALKIRKGIEYLDMDNQLKKLANICLH